MRNPSLLFHYTVNSTEMMIHGITTTLLLQRSIFITDLLPLVLRNEHFFQPSVVYAQPTPYQTPNIDGFVNRGDASVSLRWVNRTGLHLVVPPIPNYHIDSNEDATVDVLFDELMLCNRTDPASVYVPRTVSLVAVHIIGPRGDRSFQDAAQTVSVMAYISGLLAGETSASASLQTLVVFGMQSCGQPAVRQALHNVRTLNPLWSSVDGFIGVIVGNALLLGSVATLQVASVVLLRALAQCHHLERVPTFGDACSTLRAPSVSIALLFVLYQGTFYASTQVISEVSVDAGDAVIGALAFCVLLATPPLCVWWCMSAATGRDCFRYDYKSATTLPPLYRGVAAVVLLPYSKIMPPDIVRRYATLVSPYRTPHLLTPVLPLALPYVVSLLSLWHPTGSVGCRVYFWLVMLMHVAVVTFTMFVRPFRHAHGNVLFTVGTVINLTLLLCMIAAMESPRFLNTEVAAGVGVAQLSVQCAGVVTKLWSVGVDWYLVDDVPSVFLWTTRRDGGNRFANLDSLPDETTIDPGVMLVELRENEHQNYEEEIDDNNSSLSLSLEHLAHTAHSTYLIGDASHLITDLDDALARIAILRDESEGHAYF
jgi:hypothetical protein